MSFDMIRLPVDGDGKQLAARLGVGLGPAGTDIRLEVDATQPDNAVGVALFSVPFQALPNVVTAVSATPIAIDTLLLVNFSNDFVQAYVDDGAGLILVDEKLPPGARVLQLNGIHFAGLRWNGDLGINGAVKGYRAA